MSLSNRLCNCIEVKKIKDIETALKRLSRMKVNELYEYDSGAIEDNETEFDMIWKRVLHEYEMYVDKEGDYQYYDEKELNMLTVGSAVTTLKWLVSTRHLTNYKNKSIYFDDRIILK